MKGARLFLCSSCNAMVAAEGGVLREPCLCGCRYFKRPSWAPYRLTSADRRFLRSLRITPDDDPPLPLEGSPT